MLGWTGEGLASASSNWGSWAGRERHAVADVDARDDEHSAVDDAGRGGDNTVPVLSSSNRLTSPQAIS